MGSGRINSRFKIPLLARASRKPKQSNVFNLWPSCPDCIYTWLVATVFRSQSKQVKIPMHISTVSSNMHFPWEKWFHSDVTKGHCGCLCGVQEFQLGAAFGTLLQWERHWGWLATLTQAIKLNRFWCKHLTHTTALFKAWNPLNLPSVHPDITEKPPEIREWVKVERREGKACNCVQHVRPLLLKKRRSWKSCWTGCQWSALPVHFSP